MKVLMKLVMRMVCGDKGSGEYGVKFEGCENLRSLGGQRDIGDSRFALETENVIIIMIKTNILN